MDERLLMPSEKAYQIIDGHPRRVYGAKECKARIQRESHALVVHATEGATAKGHPLALWATDLRRGRLNIYGGLLRFLDHLHRRGIPMETALLIPEWISSYIRETWTGTPQADAIPLELVRTGEFRKVG